MKKNKGFTLIELLAVIVILAIIALIVTPRITEIITDARISTNARSVEGHIRNVEYAIIKKAFGADTGDLTNYDCSMKPLHTDLLAALPSSDPVTCTLYTIENGTVTYAEGCQTTDSNWKKVYKYEINKGAYVSGDKQ